MNGQIPHWKKACSHTGEDGRCLLLTLHTCITRIHIWNICTQWHLGAYISTWQQMVYWWCKFGMFCQQRVYPSLCVITGFNCFLYFLADNHFYKHSGNQNVIHSGLHYHVHTISQSYLLREGCLVCTRVRSCHVPPPSSSTQNAAKCPLLSVNKHHILHTWHMVLTTCAEVTRFGVKCIPCWQRWERVWSCLQAPSTQLG